MFDIFPEEIWTNILSYLNSKRLIEIQDTSKQFNVLCGDIIEKRKFEGFPRKTDHCIVHDVSEFMFKVKYDDEDEEYDEDIYINIGLPELIENNEIEIVLDYVLDNLYESKYDLVRGDLICLFGLDMPMNRIYIFNGYEIILLKNNEIELFWPIRADVDTKYWLDSNKIPGIPLVKFTWFDSLIIQSNIIDIIKVKRQNGRFPRPNHCNIYDVSDFNFKIKTIENGFRHVSIKKLFNKYGIEWNIIMCLILDKLYELGYDLVRGDLIYIKNSLKIFYIFDGYKMLSFKTNFNRNTNLYHEYQQQILPQEFKTSDVPPNYWLVPKAKFDKKIISALELYVDVTSLST